MPKYLKYAAYIMYHSLNRHVIKQIPFSHVSYHTINRNKYYANAYTNWSSTNSIIMLQYNTNELCVLCICVSKYLRVVQHVRICAYFW